MRAGSVESRELLDMHCSRPSVRPFESTMSYRDQAALSWPMGVRPLQSPAEPLLSNSDALVVVARFASLGP
jgi:hypothetical protein